jgi:hypothetical protein
VYLFGSVKTRKHSARLFLHVIVGSKVISLFSRLTISFLTVLVLVRDSPSGRSCFVGLYLGGIRLNRVCAFVAHLCGSSHPYSLSLTHSQQGQFALGWCVGVVGCIAFVLTFLLGPLLVRRCVS